MVRPARRIGAAIGAAGLAIAAMPAAAQGVSGTVLGAPEAGRVVGSIDVGGAAIQMPRFQFGDVYVPINAGAASSGAIFDTHSYRASVLPSGAVGWGLPGGLFGHRAEIFGQFAYARASESGSFVPPENFTGGITIPYVNGTVPGGFTGLFTGAGDTVSVTFNRRFTSYEGLAGVRLHVSRGNWSFSPGVYVGYQRTDLDEAMEMVPNTARLNVNGRANTDYYQLGITLGSTYALTQQLALFGLLRGGLDIVSAQFEGDSVFVGNPVLTASASDRATRLSGRFQLRAGAAWTPTPAVTFSLAGLAQYVGSVSSIVYPRHSVTQLLINPQDGSVPARLGSSGQFSVGGTLGATIRF